MKRLLTLVIMAALSSTSSWAIRPTQGLRQDAKRFGFNKFQPQKMTAASTQSIKAFKTFNAGQGGRWNLRVNPRTGLPSALVGNGDSARPGRPEDAARSFLTSHRDILGINPNGLRLDRQSQGNGIKHILYRQSYNGIPVEFSAVKVHLGSGNSVVGVHSTYEPDLSLPTQPSITPEAAGSTAAGDAGGGTVRGEATLVIVPLETDGQNHLAWKMRVDSRGGAWRYYVDAISGQVLFRYSINRFIGPCLSSGVVSGAVYDIDPSTTPGPVIRPFNNQYVYVGLPATQVLTGADDTYGNGFFCSPVSGKVTMSLQGPWVSVSQFRGPSAHYDNGNGVWSTVATPVSSPHPYANNSLHVTTINLSVAAPNAVKFLDIGMGNILSLYPLRI
jgi:hypothetical protein